MFSRLSTRQMSLPEHNASPVSYDVECVESLLVTNRGSDGSDVVTICRGSDGMWWGLLPRERRQSNTCTSITDNLIVTLIDPTKPTLATLSSSSHSISDVCIETLSQVPGSYQRLRYYSQV